MRRRETIVRTTLMIERLCSRELMAADIANVGGFCTEFDGRAPLSSINSTAAPKGTARFTYTVLGDPKDALVQPSPGLALLGGGSDVDAAFAWMASHANGGDFVVLSTSKNSYSNYINSLGTLNSVASLVVPDRAAAEDDTVAQIVSSAEALFITGGDQSNYISAWANTGLETAIYSLLARGGVLGGSSAGLAVLGNVDYAALNSSTTSAEALANPLSSSITLNNTFITPDDVTGTPLQYLQDTLTDSHFMQRDRMGRTLAFLARADHEDRVFDLPRGIAINEQTALLIEGNGQSIVVGNPYARKVSPNNQQRSVYILQPTVNATLQAGVALSYHAQVQRLTFDPRTNTSDSFDFTTWQSLTSDNYTIDVASGVMDADMVGNPNVGIYGPIVV